MAMKENSVDKVRGLDISKDITIAEFLKSVKHTGFQATNLGKAAEIVEKMKRDKATIFLAFTSNMVSSGLRDVFAYLAKNKLIDVIITSVGSVEEDLIKSQKPFLLGSFDMNDIELHKEGVNRIGNVLVPNDRYEHLEKVLQPFFAKMHDKQKKTGKMVSPSELIRELGVLAGEDSFIYWASKNGIPVFCPAITDGAFGLQAFFYKQDHKDFGIDVTADMQRLAEIVLQSKKAGAIILGGGVAKHHTIGVNILRDGLDYAVYVTTAGEGDGSVAGARPREAKSWSKLKEESHSVCVEGDATIVFSLLAFALKD
ncbi:MAG: deoxyhypusine synthase [Candidatus Aenigmarchaeota archaeon]|nr:deoxyhypusine synthase [Candidatus Aenigmarchaeota archaeon]